MGYLLAKEVAAGRPPKPGPEWWLLLDLALDADDVTRQTACGYEYMAAQTQAPRSTIFRWLRRLTNAGLLKVVQHSQSKGRGGGPGLRAVYEIQVPARVTARSAGQVIRSHKKGPDSAGNQVSQLVGPDSEGDLGVSGNHVSSAARPPLPRDLNGQVPLENASRRSDQDRSDEKDEQKTPAPQREARRAPAA